MTRLLATAVLIATLAMTSVASAAHLKFEAALSGAEEVPPVATDGTGTAKLGVHANRVIFRLRWEGLTSPAMAAHIHCGETGENGPVGVTLFAGAMGTKGHVNGRFTAPDPANACGWADLSDVIEAMSSGATYVNVHTQQFPGGEIRGQVAAD
ncbi:MAG: CHRD domain-containing protein [Candidatus Limnocylindria bacterium]